MARWKKDPEYVAPGLEGKLLRQGAWCKLHFKRYAANVKRGDRIEASDCPQCIDDRAWAQKALREMQAAGEEITSPTLLARAEKLAGHRLERYIHE